MMHYRKMKVEGTVSESSPTVNVCISCVEASCSVTGNVEEWLLFQVLGNLAHTCTPVPACPSQPSVSIAVLQFK
jgi:hypothetical protein